MLVEGMVEMISLFKDKQGEIKEQIMTKDNVNNDGLLAANSVFSCSPCLPDVGLRAGALKSLDIWLK